MAGPDRPRKCPRDARRPGRWRFAADSRPGERGVGVVGAGLGGATGHALVGRKTPKGLTVEVRVSGASSVIVHRVPDEGAERLLERQRGISAATAGLPGYRATDVYPPAEGQQEWVVILHFANPEDQQRWLGSPLRAEWLAKLDGAAADFQVKTLSGGF